MKEYPWLKSIRREFNKPKKYCKGQHRALFQHLPPAHPRKKGTAHRQLDIILFTRPFVSCLFVKYALSRPRLLAKLV